MPQIREASASTLIKVHITALAKEATTVAWRNDGVDVFTDADTQTLHVTSSGGNRTLIDGRTAYEQTLFELAQAYRVGMHGLTTLNRVSVWRNPVGSPTEEGTPFEVFSLAIQQGGNVNNNLYQPAAVGTYTFRDNARNSFRFGVKSWGFPLGGRFSLPSNNPNIDPVYNVLLSGGFTSRYGLDLVQGLRVTTSTWDSLERVYGFR
jgi:hypothetical protein